MLLPHLLALTHAFATTLRREPMLVVADSINFEDALGRKFTLQYGYYRHWPVIFCQGSVSIRNRSADNDSPDPRTSRHSSVGSSATFLESVRSPRENTYFLTAEDRPLLSPKLDWRKP